MRDNQENSMTSRKSTCDGLRACVAIVAACLALPFLSLPPVVVAQTPATEAGARVEAPASRGELEDLERRVESASDNSDRLFNLLAVLVAILTGGGVLGVVLSFRNEQRASETHNTLLAGSQETLNLVNGTLALAKDASKRAEEAVRGKAVERLRDLDQQAENILEEVHHAGNFKHVVRDPGTEEQLKGIAERFSGFEEFAENEAPELAPHCMFAKGLDRHLKSLPEPAIASWNRAAEVGNKPELSALALFWVGYEQSNIGQFDDAAIAYGKAWESHLKDEGRAQHHELRRSQIQARFFELAQEMAEQGDVVSDRRLSAREFITDLYELVRSLGSNRTTLKEEREECCATIGEILVWSARLSPLERQGFEPLTDIERECLEEAARWFEVARHKVWARFGLAQVKWKLGADSTQLSKTEYEELLQSMLGEAELQREARTMALRHAAILIMEGEHHDGEEKLDRAHRDLTRDMGRIRGKLTVFSPWQKRNIPSEDFKQEVDAYRDACRVQRKKSVGQKIASES
jgi:tetratricopeptide (TPR) repeat protein